MITGKTEFIAHLGFPTESFKAPMIYNPYFEARGINAVVVPMSAQAEGYPELLAALFRLTNIRGALITMPHKVTTLALLAEASPAAKIAGACNAVKQRADGTLQGDMFDGEGFVRGVLNKGRALRRARVFVCGSGGVGSAIAASIAARGPQRLALYDVNGQAAEALAARLKGHYPAIEVTTGSNDPAGFDVAVNATPLGMREGDPMPFDVSRLSPSAFAGEVVMKKETTAFLAAAQARGCLIQPGIDMLFEQIPAYLEFFGFPAATADELRRLARIEY